MNILTLLFNSSSIAFCVSPIVLFVVLSDFSHCVVLTHESGFDRDVIVSYFLFLTGSTPVAFV
jgi:hypothetical protein